MKSNTVDNTKKVVFTGVFVLIIANFLIKSVGLISKIALNRIIGPVGVGYYSSAYEIYSILYIISTAGLPVALSIIISKSIANKRNREVRKIFNVSTIVFLILGICLTCLLIVFSSFLSSFIGAEETKNCITFIAPALIFISLSSIVRGYFQGYQIMMPTAISQFIEAFCKVFFGIGFALFAKSKGYEDYIVASYAIFGITCGVFFGMVFLYLTKIFYKNDEMKLEKINNDENSISSIALLKQVLLISLPIVISSLTIHLTTIIDTFSIQKSMLEYTNDSELIKASYGDYMSLVISIVSLPTIFLYPISTSISPILVKYKEEDNIDGYKETRKISFKTNLMISIPFSIGFAVFSKQILTLLFFRDESVLRSYSWLSVSAASILFIGLISISTAFLNTSGKQIYPLISLIVGLTSKVVANYILIPIIGMYGASLSTILCYFIIALMNFIFVLKITGKIEGVLINIGKILLSSVLAIGIGFLICFGLEHLIPYYLSSLLSVLVTFVVYFILVFKTKIIVEDEIKLIPKGDSICKILKRIRLI